MHMPIVTLENHGSTPTAPGHEVATQEAGGMVHGMVVSWCFLKWGKPKIIHKVSLVVGKPIISVGPGKKNMLDVGKDHSLRMFEIGFVPTWARMENMMTMAFASMIFSNYPPERRGTYHICAAGYAMKYHPKTWPYINIYIYICCLYLLLINIAFKESILGWISSLDEVGYFICFL